MKHTNVKIILALAITVLINNLSLSDDLTQPGFRRVSSEPVTPGEAREYMLHSEKVLSASVIEKVSAAETSSEMAELARGLKHDPDLIYKFVHDHIDYTPIYGSVKGAYMTLMDRKGNDFDQASLLITLLRQSGYSANYVYGIVRLMPEQITNWLGVPSDSNVIGWLLGSAGIPAIRWTYPNGSLAFVDVDHVWVKVNIDGTDYVFDPSLKSYNYKSGIDLPSTMGYDPNYFLDRAKEGATIDPCYVKDINKSNIVADLTLYSSNLIDYIRSNNLGAELSDIIGGRNIVATSDVPRQTSLPYEQSVDFEWTEIPGAYKISLRIQHRGIDTTLYSSDVYGKRLTIFYNSSNQPVLALDGEVLAVGNVTTPGTAQSITITIDHPYAALGGTYCDETQTFQITAGGSYFIVNGWAGTGRRIIEKHRQVLTQNRYASSDEDAEDVLGESLIILGLTWLAECYHAGEICDQIAETATIRHHNLGIFGHYDSPYIDMPMSLVSVISKTDDSAKKDAGFFTNSGHNSAFEWGVIEQLQPYRAVSTVKLFDIANDKGDKIFNVDKTNWPPIKPQLKNYNPNELSHVEAYTNADWRVILLEDGDLGQDDWKGIGFLAINPSEDQIAHIISGGLHGGNGTTEGDVDNQEAGESGENVHDPEYTTDEPIDLITGDYSYQQRDISIGNGAYPFSLEFRRMYNSRDRLQDGPLGLGWAHNLNVYVTKDSDGFQGLGYDSPFDAAAAIVETYVSLDLIESSKSHINLSIATLAHYWFMERLIDNLVTVNQPGKTMQFIKLPDGSFNPPPGEAAVLSVEGDQSYSLRTKHGEYLDFDPNGRIITWSDPNNIVSYTYEPDGRLSRINNEFGRFLSLTYDAIDPNHISMITDSTGRRVRHDFDLRGNLLSITDPNGFITNFLYDPNNDGRITKIYYPSAPEIPFVTNTYDSLGRIIAQTNARGYTYDYYYSGYRTEEVDPNGYSKTYYFDDNSKLLVQEDALGNVTAYQYDGQQRQTQIIYPRGNATQFLYDGNHNVIQTIQIPIPGSTVPNIVEMFTYETEFNRVTSYIDPNGNITCYSYYPNGKLKRIEQPEVNGQIPLIKFTYNSQGQVETNTGPEGMIAKYEYDPVTSGLLRTIVDYGFEPNNLNLVTEMTYDAVGNVISVTDSRNNTTTFEYGPLRRLVKTTAPAPFNYITRYEYDPDGNLKIMQRETDDPTQPWQTTRYIYTPTGMQESVIDPNGNVTLYEYDLLDRLWKITDAEGNITERFYDAVGRLQKVIDAEGNDSVAYAYTVNGKLKSLTDAKGNTTSYEYDGHDRLNKTIYPDSSYEQFTYDITGNIVGKRTRAGHIINYSYDPLNRLSTKTLPGEPNIVYEYDLVGRLLQVTDENGTINHNFDNIGRLTNVVYPDHKTVSYQYDAAGNRTLLAYPDETYVTYEYDAINRLVKISDADGTAVVEYEYDALSRRTATNYANGTTASYSYDIADRLLSLNNQVSGANHKFNYRYDQVGNRLSMTVNDTEVHNYSYDKIYQLNDADYPDGFFVDDTTFNYDTVGNRETVISGGTTNYNSNNLNQYTSVGGVSYDYDDNGNLTSDGTNSYSYDAENRLADANTLDHYVTYQFGPFGRRITKDVDSEVTRYLYDGDQVICEYDNSGRLERKFLYGTGIDETIRMIVILPSADIAGGGNVGLDDLAALTQTWLLESYDVGFNLHADLNEDGRIDLEDYAILAGKWRTDGRRSEDYFYHYDGIGSVITLTNTSDNTVEAYSYDVYGQPDTTSSIGNPYMFTGRRLDEEPGLYYYRARYYDPFSGRFLQKDPIGYAGNLNLYTYCNNNPVKWIDPLGLCKDEKERSWWQKFRDFFDTPEDRSLWWGIVTPSEDNEFANEFWKISNEQIQSGDDWRWQTLDALSGITTLLDVNSNPDATLLERAGSIANVGITLFGGTALEYVGKLEKVRHFKTVVSGKRTVSYWMKGDMARKSLHIKNMQRSIEAFSGGDTVLSLWFIAKDQYE